tara:strand:+ start:10 stop:1008 length:999 start_codon:yes stop_codon:yes gene_type:complete
MKSKNSNFVDYVKIFCRSGKGGSGSTHFLRDRTTAKGGPDGGDGGDGGSVIVKGNSQMWTLLHLKYKRHLFAQDGGPGSGNHKHGKDGNNNIINVPLGTIIKEEETGKVIFEITENNQEYILTKGGKGGKGNSHFKSSTNQSPRYAQPGIDSVEGYFILELKILADVGLVGLPNAGKSTLLSVVSAAKPEIANYPFTTLVPNLGIVSYHNDQSFIMADIPGIIEGAAEGKGLGIRFLRHIERNSTLLFMVPSDSKDINEEYLILLKELKKYNPELLDKKRILAITKSDMLDEDLINEISEALPKEISTIFISSIAQKGLNELKNIIWKKLNE